VFLLPIAVLAVPPAGLNVPIAVYLAAPVFIGLLWIDYTERRKTKKNLFLCIKHTKNVLVFLLSVEVLPEADPNEFRFRTLYGFFFSKSFFSLCKLYLLMCGAVDLRSIYSMLV
jgi:hypothetical protein